jgi:hypothetical protein
MSPRITAPPMMTGGTTVAALARGIVVIEAAERSGTPDHRPARRRVGLLADACPRLCHLRDAGWRPRAHPRPALRVRDQRRRHHCARATAADTSRNCVTGRSRARAREPDVPSDRVYMRGTARPARLVRAYRT